MLNVNITICKKYIKHKFSVESRLIINIAIDGIKPKVIIIDIISETNCHLNFKVELEIPEENLTIDCPKRIMAIIDHSVL
jgi:hypothetical protein